jgi:hypothetical protein
MSVGDLNALYWKILREYCLYCDVPKECLEDIVDELHEAFKTLFEVKSISKGNLTKQQMHEYVQKVQMILAREYGFSLDQDEELKFN